MPRTSAMARLRRLVRLALHCDRIGVPARDTIERVNEQANVDRRRRLLLSALGTASLAPVVAVVPKTHAAPRFRGGVGIVGAGLAGLACADRLSAKGIAAAVYEAADRVGGRCWSLRNFFPGQVAERGGEFIDTTHSTLRGYANAFGLPLEDVTKEPGKITYYFDGQHYEEAQVVEEFRAFVPAMRADLRMLARPTADKFSEADRRLDLTPLSDYLTSRGAGRLIRKVLDLAYTIEYGLDTSRQSCLAFLLFAHADRRSKFHPFGVFSDERFHVVAGNDLITQGLANRIPGQVSLGHRLLRVRKLQGGRIQLAFDAGSRVVENEHDAVVLALPFSVLRQIELDASLGLPEWKRAAIANFQYGTNSKMMIGFNGRPWLVLNDSNGGSYSDLPNHQSTWETNPARASAAAILTDYSGGVRGASLLPAQAQQEALRFLQDLDKVYPGSLPYAERDRKGKFRVHLENWLVNPLALGSYTCPAPGYFTSIAGNEAKAIGNLFFAGEHADSFYDAQGFLEGAANSGLRAATEVAALK